MHFDIVGEIDNIRVIAKGRGVRSRKMLAKKYGAGRWRKMKGVVEVGLVTGRVRRAEIHWYECHGIGRQNFKIKKFLD
ncbi:MAG: hypothetical protein GXP26_06660 [Planctomycetes bacterium]|nr:hypothetical protein [Planctomycetota bacterium]